MARPGLSNHPKFRRFAHSLGEGVAAARGHLELMWEVGYEAGNPVLGDSTDVALACHYQGDAEHLVRALSTCGGDGRAGFIEPVEGDPGRWQIHDLLINAPAYVRRRLGRERERTQPLSEIRRAAALSRWAARPINGSDDIVVVDSDMLPLLPMPPVEEKKTKRRKVSVDEVTLPPALETPEMRAALSRWFQHRNEIRKPITPTTIDQKVREFETLGVERSIAAIEYSIANGWTGIFEPKTNGNKPATTEPDAVAVAIARRRAGGTNSEQ